MNLHLIQARLLGAIAATAITAAFITILVVDSSHMTDESSVAVAVHRSAAGSSHG